MNEESNKVEEAAAPMADAAEKTITKIEGRDWKGWLLLAGGAGALLWGLVAAVGSGWGLWNWTSGFTGVTWSFFLGLATLLLALIFGWWNRRKTQRGSRMLHWGGIILALLYVGWIGSQIISARSVPAIHDISTDLADPPEFKALALREDNWDNIPGEDDKAMSGMNPQQRWRKLHQGAYGDIRSVRVDETVAKVLEKAERLAEDRGWDVKTLRAAEGRLEATATTALFRFKDDVVIRIRPTEDNAGSIVDMRSVSRVGVSDLGVNAKRVRSFLSDLSRN